jgi:hypothetical protein
VTIVWEGPTAIDRTRFEAHETIVVRPGASVRFAKDTEIRGRLEVTGTVGKPVQLDGGRLRLRGPGTSGSWIERAIVKTRGLEIFDSEGVRLRDVTIVPPPNAKDVLHATYARALSVHEVTIVRSPGDAVDLEHTTAELRGLKVLGAGDECLDLMGSDVRLTDSLLLGCRNSAVSAGEETTVHVLGSAIVDARTGVLSKNASSARVSRTLIYRTEGALRTNRRDVHYDRPSRLDADEVYAVACGRIVKRARQTFVDARTETTWPAAGRLSQLRTQVLGIERWEQLDHRIGVLMGAP